MSAVRSLGMTNRVRKILPSPSLHQVSGDGIGLGVERVATHLPTKRAARDEISRQTKLDH